jgi:hypothetical protein
MSLAMRDERIPKINIEGIIKEEFVNCIINDPLIKVMFSYDRNSIKG